VSVLDSHLASTDSLLPRRISNLCPSSFIMALFCISSIESFIALCSYFAPLAIGFVAFESPRHGSPFT
jgi:hypothetical protein